MIGQYWLGQIDVFLCLGGCWRSGRKARTGAGRIDADDGQAADCDIGSDLFIGARGTKELLRVLAVPAAVLAISLAVYGIDWPLRWFENATINIPDHPWKMASEFFWPWGLVLLPLPFLFKDREEGTLVSYMVSALAFPFFSVYSYIVFLIFESPWWVLPVSYAYKLFQPWLGLEVMKMAWILPLTMLLVHVNKRFGLSVRIKSTVRRAG